MGKIAGSAMLMAGLALTGPALGQGFSGNGAGGVAALGGTTASPGNAGNPAVGGAADVRALAAPETAKSRRGLAPTEIDFAPRRNRAGRVGLPF